MTGESKTKNPTIRLQAETLHNNLSNNKRVRIKLTDTRKLILAGYGLTRETKKEITQPEIFDPTTINKLIAEQYSHKNITWVNTILGEVRNIITPGDPEDNTPVEIEYESICVTTPATTLDWIGNFTLSDACDKLISHTVDILPLHKFGPPAKEPIDQHTANTIAGQIIDHLKRYNKSRNLQALHYRGVITTLHGYKPSHSERIVQAINKGIEQTDLDKKIYGASTTEEQEDWSDEIEKLIISKAIEKDRSKQIDAFSENDRAEIIIRLSSATGNHKNSIIRFENNRPTPSNAIRTGSLDTALANLGYSIESYRLHFKIKIPKSDLPRKWIPPVPKTRKLMTLDQLGRLLETASQNCGICLYTIVPLRDLVDLDPKQPMMLTHAVIVCYDPADNSFRGETQIENIELPPNAHIAGINPRHPTQFNGPQPTKFDARLQNIRLQNTKTGKSAKEPKPT